MTTVKTWGADVAQRAVSTAAQTALGLVTANTAGWTHLGIAAVGSAAGLAAVICVLQHLSDLKGTLPDPLTAVFTTTSGTVATSPPMHVQTSNAPATPVVTARDTIEALPPTAPAA